MTCVSGGRSHFRLRLNAPRPAPSSSTSSAAAQAEVQHSRSLAVHWDYRRALFELILQKNKHYDALSDYFPLLKAFWVLVSGTLQLSKRVQLLG